MTALTLPAPEAPAEEWGRLAISILGWRTVAPSMKWRGEEGIPMSPDWLPWPDPDDPATAGCLLALLGPDVNVLRRRHKTLVTIITDNLDFGHYPQGRGTTLGRACIAVAAAHGRWPGGAG